MLIRPFALAAAVALIPFGQAVAHDHHDNEAQQALSEEALKARATDEMNRLISIKKIDVSWKGMPVKGIEQRGSEMVVTFENAKAKENKVLYVFLRPSGDVVATNFTGK